MKWNGGFKKLKKMKNENGMEQEKWVRQTKGKSQPFISL